MARDGSPVPFLPRLEVVYIMMLPGSTSYPFFSLPSAARHKVWNGTPSRYMPCRPDHTADGFRSCSISAGVKEFNTWEACAHDKCRVEREQ